MRGFDVLLLSYAFTLVVIFQGSVAPGTDSSRFTDRLTALRAEVFFWHESMWIGEASVNWEPDLVWRKALDQKIQWVKDEASRVPKSPCGQQARDIVESHTLWIADTIDGVAAVESAWDVTISKLPLACGEF
jgi:hypothetical protein